MRPEEVTGEMVTRSRRGPWMGAGPLGWGTESVCCDPPGKELGGINTPTSFFFLLFPVSYCAPHWPLPSGNRPLRCADVEGWGVDPRGKQDTAGTARDTFPFKFYKLSFK